VFSSRVSISVYQAGAWTHATGRSTTCPPPRFGKEDSAMSVWHGVDDSLKAYRLMHHCHLVTIRGNSYRMRQRTELWQPLHAAPDDVPAPRPRRRSWQELLAGGGDRPEARPLVDCQIFQDSVRLSPGVDISTRWSDPPKQTRTRHLRSRGGRSCTSCSSPAARRRVWYRYPCSTRDVPCLTVPTVHRD
jgi:hypothetical protein